MGLRIKCSVFTTSPIYEEVFIMKIKITILLIIIMLMPVVQNSNEDDIIKIKKEINYCVK